MTPQEKAEELYCKYDALFKAPFKKHQDLKQCVLIAVDEIFEFMKMDDEYTETVSNANSKWVNYWQEVKQEIQNS